MFDIFPLNFQFNIKDNQLKKTLGGGICSFLLVITTVALVFYNLYTFFSNRSTFVFQSDVFIGNQRAELFQLDKINLVQVIYDDKISPVPLKISSSVASFLSGEISNNILSNNITKIGNFEKCSKATNNISMNISDNLVNKLSIPLDLQICFVKLAGKDHVELGGDIATTQQIKQIQMSMKSDFCQIDPNICNNSLVLKRIQFTFALYFQNYFINMSSDVGYEGFIDHSQILTNANSDINLAIKIKKNTIYTDNNILMSFFPHQVENYYTYSMVDISTIEKTGPPNFITLNLIIDLDKYQTFYRRSYMKLDQLLASTISVFSVLLLIFKNLTKFVEFGSLEYYLMNKLYYFDSNSEYKSIKMRNHNLTNKMHKNNLTSNFILNFRIFRNRTK